MAKLLYGIGAIILLSIFTITHAQIKEYYNSVRAVKVITGSLSAGSDALFRCYKQCGIQYCDDHCKAEIEHFSNLGAQINSGTAYYIDNTYDYIDNPNDLTDCLINCDRTAFKFAFDVKRAFQALNLKATLHYECLTFEKCWAEEAGELYDVCLGDSACRAAVNCAVGKTDKNQIDNCVFNKNNANLDALIAYIEGCYEDEKSGYSNKLSLRLRISGNPDDD
jgi:hypothetical protein